MLISHPAEKNVKSKPLKEHLFNVGESSRKKVKESRLNLTVIEKNDLEQLAFFIGIFHDFGKATTFFQEYIKSKEHKGDQWTKHSLLSAAVCYYFVKDELQSRLWAYAAFMVIKRHHGNLEAFERTEDDYSKSSLSVAKKQLKNSIDKYYNELEAFYSDHVKQFERVKKIDFSDLSKTMKDPVEILDDFFEDDKEKRIEFFFINNYLFSLLIDNDKKDAARLESDYFKDNLKEPPNHIWSYIAQLRKDDPGKFAENIPINRLRNRFLDEISENRTISPHNHFYTVTAPTGIGKTFGCLHFANHLIEKLPGKKARIIYCLPYTSIIDQNFDEFEKIIRFNKGSDYDKRPSRYLLKHHYLTPKKIEKRVNQEDYSYKDYLDDVLLVESWESAVIVTTFVQFFHTVIGYRNRFLKKFHNIVNSIVILDEVQNIDPHYYQLLKEVLHILGHRFNIYFLLATATQPEIFDAKKHAPAALVNSTFFMEHSIFNRIKLFIETTPQTLQTFSDTFCDQFQGENCLIVTNTKSSAVELFKCIKKKKTDYNVLCLSTYLVPFDRREKIVRIKESLKKGEKIIVISTQLIEAGVDISFKYVYRDFGPIDSVIQVAGRCNRHGEYGDQQGHMKLVRLINEKDKNRPFNSYIYSPFITQIVERSLKNKVYESKDFEKISNAYFKQLDFKKESRKLIEAICNLNYDMELEDETPVKDFKLINEYESENIYILTTQRAQDRMDHLIECLDQIYNKELNEAEFDQILLEVELLKTEMRDFQISLREDELGNYVASHVINDKWFIRYISYIDQKKFAYDPAIGFLKVPKEEISTAAYF
jgi:CRISPR-associated endonuclease/helicase Cas3